MPVKVKKRKRPAKKLQKGSVGNFFVFIVLVILIIAGLSAVGGLPTQIANNNGQVVAVVTPSTNGNSYSNLQLKTFGYVTLAPTPTLAAPPPQQVPPVTGGLCQPGGVNNESQIIAATLPASGQSISPTGQVKVWVTDEGEPMIAPGETVNSDGSIATAGNRASKADDNYLYEPALYLDSFTAEMGGTPHFPNYIKGQVNNDPSHPVMTVITSAAVPADPLPAGKTSTCLNTNFFKCYTAEYIWNIASLGLTSGNHRAEFVIHDGDFDRGVGCIDLQIQ